VLTPGADAHQIRVSSEFPEEQQRGLHIEPRHSVSSHGISESRER